jgi:hypothetical protein
VIQQGTVILTCNVHCCRAASVLLASMWDQWRWRWLVCWPHRGCGTSAARPADTLAPGYARARAQSSSAAPQCTATCCLRATVPLQHVWTMYGQCIESLLSRQSSAFSPDSTDDTLQARARRHSCQEHHSSHALAAPCQSTLATVPRTGSDSSNASYSTRRPGA